MQALEDKLLNVTRTIEKQVDQAIEQLGTLDVNDLESLRKNRFNELKKQEEKKRMWANNGHGKYEELPEEKMFFEIIKKSERVVVHFFTNSSERCKILDKHLKILAPKHIETLFVSLNAEKCPFLSENLKIKTIPTLVLVKNAIMVDKIIGFAQIGNRDDFATEDLEWRIAQNEIIDYEGDLSTPPSLESNKPKSSGKKIRDGTFNGDDLDDDELVLTKDDIVRGNEHLSTELTSEEAAELGLD